MVLNKLIYFKACALCTLSSLFFNSMPLKYASTNNNSNNKVQILYNSTNNSQEIEFENINEHEFVMNSYAYNTREVENEIMAFSKSTASHHEKIAFLTFDDGPSITNTPKILDILDSYNIKGTFFILGEQLENQTSKEILKRMYKDGHAIGNHTYCHNYKYLYPNRYADTEHIISDLNKNETLMKSVLGNNFSCNVVRMPGGFFSWKNTAALKAAFNENNLKYVDWNVLTGDAEGGPRNKEQLINRFKQTFKNQNTVVILMHDTYGKESTVEALPYIIDILKEKGYSFGVLV